MKNNSINLVVLGNFNPAILTHDFLVNICKFDLGDNFSPEPPIMPPVATSLVYGNISFHVDLGRLQITEKNCENLKSSQIATYLDTYLQKLSYTPVIMCGANINYDVPVKQSKLDTIQTWLQKDRSVFAKLLELKSIELDTSFIVDDGSEKVNKWLLRTGISDYNAVIRLTVSSIPDSDEVVKVNFNFEVPNLDRDKKLLTSITTDYPKVVDLFEYYINKIFVE